MVVGEHGAADARQRGVAPEEVSGEPVDEVKQVPERGAAHVHGRVLVVHADAVLVEVPVRGELPEPRFVAERGGDGAQRALVAPREALVLMADRACGVSAGHRVARGGLLHVLEFGLGEVDGDDQAVGVEARVLVEHALLDIVVGDAVVVEPAHGLHAAMFAFHCLEPVLHGGRRAGEHAHHDVRVHGSFVGVEQPRRDGRGAEPRQQVIGQRVVAGRAGGTVRVEREQLEDAVARPVGVARVEFKPLAREVDERVDARVDGVESAAGAVVLLLFRGHQRAVLSMTSSTMARISSAFCSISCTSLIWVRARTRLCSGYLVAKYVSPAR